MELKVFNSQKSGRKLNGRAIFEVNSKTETLELLISTRDGRRKKWHIIPIPKNATKEITRLARLAAKPSKDRMAERISKSISPEQIAKFGKINELAR